MHIYKLYLDTFKHSYRGYWSDLEKAIAILPDCPRFKQAITWLGPRYREENDLIYSPFYEHNSKIKPKLVIVENARGYAETLIEIWLENHRTNVSKKVTIQEVKVEGQPYQPTKTEYIKQNTLFENVCIGYIEVTKIEIDCLQERD